MKICWFGIYDVNYSRNYILLNGLKEQGIEVVHCGVSATERFRYLKLAWKFINLSGNSFDLVYVAFPAQSAVPVARFLTLKPIVMDCFYSMFDSVVRDRKIFGPRHPFSLWMGLLDWVGMKLADLIITDTHAHANYFSSWWGLSKKQYRVVPIGSDEKYFFPTDSKRTDDDFLVEYHGSYIPLQGIPLILDAIDLIKDEPGYKFRFIGSGQTYGETRKRAEELNLPIEFIERIPFTEVNQYLADADVILGIFGDTPKTNLVIPNKLFEGLAVRKPLISLDTKVVREELSDKDLILIERSPEALAEAIRKLKSDSALSKQYADNGYETFKTKLSQTHIAKRLLDCLGGI